MRDPFRPNSNNQLIREAQFAFVVIVVLLGVLVYVAVGRVSGRRFYFNQIAKTAPLAQHINDTAYPAQTIRDQEESSFQSSTELKQRTVKRELNHKANQTGAVDARAPSRPAPTKTFSSHRQTASPTTERQSIAIADQTVANPVDRVSATDQTTATSIAQAQFIEPSEPILPPPIRSNFGAGSTRALPILDTQTNKATANKATAKKTPVKNAIAAALSPRVARPRPAVSKQSRLSAFVPPQKTASDFDPLLSSKKISKTNLAVNPKKQIPESKPQPKPQPKPESPPQIQPLGPDEYRVQTTDSLWSIAQTHYGDGRFFRALHEHNRGRITSADRLEPNTTLVIPSADELMKRYAKFCPADKLSDRSSAADAQHQSNLSNVAYDAYEKRMQERFHITQSGDTLFDVARKRLGQASRYLEIFELNRFRIPQHVNHLTPLGPGIKLLLPE